MTKKLQLLYSVQVSKDIKNPKGDLYNLPFKFRCHNGKGYYQLKIARSENGKRQNAWRDEVNRQILRNKQLTDAGQMINGQLIF